MRGVRLGGLIAAAAGLAGCRLGSPDDLVTTLPSGSTNVGGIFQVTGSACATAYAASAYGHVVYTVGTLHGIFRVEALAGSNAENLSTELDRLSPGADSWVNQSADGQSLLISTTRFGCTVTSCLAIVAANACSAQVIVDASGNPISAAEWSAIGTLANGDLVTVFGLSSTGPHPMDLYALKRHDGKWDTSVLLTGASPYAYHGYPTLSADGTTVLFDCGTNSYSGGPGTSMCEVGTDGTGFRVVHAESDGPPDGGSWPLHKSNYSPDGAIVFEGEWPNGREEIWQYPPSSATPALVNDQQTSLGTPLYNDDNTPCVLADGRIASLWLDRPGNAAGLHELKVMNADGSGGAMLVVNVDVTDIGHGCGK
jgi:hypothetical protein